MQFSVSAALTLQFLLYVVSTESSARCPVKFKAPDGKCLRGCMFDSHCAPGQICCKSGCWSSCVKLTTCQLERRRLMSRGGIQPFIPKCDDAGNYKEIQCGLKRDSTVCWRVNKNGKKVPRSDVTIDIRQPKLTTGSVFPKNIEDPDKENEDEVEPGMATRGRCPKKRKRRLRLKRINPGVFVPRCKVNGKFKRVQCNSAHNRCWCVDTTSGKEIPGTKTRKRRPNCRQNHCGRKLYRKRRIVGGYESTQGAWPWQAALFLNGTQHRCGAALIKSSWLLTAAHCFNTFALGVNDSSHKQSGLYSSTNPSDWEVRLGEHSFLKYERSEKHLRVLEIKVHPRYVPGNLTHPGDYDVALVRISRSVKLGRTVNSICLPEDFKYFKPGKRCVIAGWGKTSWNGSASPVLREAWVDLVSRRVCNADASYGGKISKRFICAGYKEGGIDSCAYDSGGPLMCPWDNGRWVLAGIVSWGEKCALPYKYGIYSNVHEFVPWITRTLRLDR